MKGLDTPVLLGLLEGTARPRAVVRALSGEELATTEVNLFELELLARREKAPGRERRLLALDRLRRSLTVLPIDEEATRRAALLAASSRQAAPEGTWLALGAAEARGCSEWLTTSSAVPPPCSTRVKISAIERWKPQKR